MRRFFVFFICFICLGVNFSFGYTEDDLIAALNKSYKVGEESFRLPSSIRNKAVNYIKANDITESQCNSLMAVLNEAVSFANKVGTTDISKISSEDLKTAVSIVNKAASILDMEVKVNSTLDKVIAAEKGTGKIVEEVEKKDVFFKSTGTKRNNVFWFGIALFGLVILIILYVLLLRFVKFSNIDFLCNTVLLLYIVCAMPFICFGDYIEILNLLEPVLASRFGEGYIDVVDVEIKDYEVEHSSGSNENLDVNISSGNDKRQDIDKEKVPEAIKYPVLGEMYAKLDIPACGINLSVYYGDNDKILESGVGHFSGSHFPGQGKGILYTAHNTADKLYNLKDIKVGNKVNIVTNFGKFSYKVTSTSIINDTDKSKAYIESDKEILMIYTCYPFDKEGYTNKRFMVYCERIGG